MTDPATDTSAPADTLAAALARHQLNLPAAHVVQLEKYARLLWDWNEKINLTRHTDYEKFVARDVLDSWQLSQLLLPGDAVLDVGSGGGVPGIILAILRPDVEVSLCESIGKKAKVLEDIVSKLKLETHVYHCRAEEVLEDERFTAVTARAVGSIQKMCTWFKPHWASIGRLLTIKGPSWLDERSEARHAGAFNDLELRVAAKYPMPGTDSESVILKLWPKGSPEK